MSFGRDTDVGYSTTEDTVSTILTRVETLLTVGITTFIQSPSGKNLDDLIGKLSGSLVELKRIRKTAELTLGQTVGLD